MRGAGHACTLFMPSGKLAHTELASRHWSTGVLTRPLQERARHGTLESMPAGGACVPLHVPQSARNAIWKTRDRQRVPRLEGPQGAHLWPVGDGDAARGRVRSDTCRAAHGGAACAAR